jgi:hypothetical protein
MPRWSLVLALVVAAASTSAGSATVPEEQFVVPYLSGGAGVYVDDDGRPVTSEGAPTTPGIHVRPSPPRGPVPTTPPMQPVPPPAENPVQPVQPLPPPVAPPAPIPEPPSTGYQRPDLVAAVALPNVTSVFCRADAAWPTDPVLASATGYWMWGGDTITMRTFRCEGIAGEKVGTEAFARGLFVLAHEAAHAAGYRYECDADIQGLKTMGAISARLGWGATAGEDAARFINDYFRPNPPPDPYCLGRVPYPWP